MNKLLMILRRDFNDDIVLIANNHKDLEDYLKREYDYYSVEVSEEYVYIVARAGYKKEYGTLEWVKHI